MADMGFLPEVKRLLDACADQRQTLLFSATLDGDVDVIIRRYLHDPLRHEQARSAETADTAEHHFWAVERPDRVDVTAQIVDRTGATVVFCRTKRGADRIARQLGSRGVAAVAIHGDRSQNQRERALEDFRSGRATAIVATDVAARGIHVDGVACVVHFDPTADAKDYVHRSGRTGRAGAAGAVVSLVPDEARRDLVRQQRSLGRDIRVVAPEPALLVEAVPSIAPPPRPAGDGPSRSGGPKRNRNRNRSSGGKQQASRNRGGGQGANRAQRSGANRRGGAGGGRSRGGSRSGSSGGRG